MLLQTAVMASLSVGFRVEEAGNTHEALENNQSTRIHDCVGQVGSSAPRTTTICQLASDFLTASVNHLGDDFKCQYWRRRYSKKQQEAGSGRICHGDGCVVPSCRIFANKCNNLEFITVYTFWWRV